jgi:anti-sigma B factor antagonist
VIALKIDVGLIDGWLKTVAVVGELDAYTAPQLQETIAEALAGDVAWILVDLRKADYMDSVGLGILIGGCKRAGERNGDLAVACDRPNLCRVFDVSGTTDMLNVSASLEAAVDRLATERAARGGCPVPEGGADQ